MKKFIKVVLLVLMFTLSVTVIACTGTETEGTTTTPTTETTTETLTTETPDRTAIAGIEELVELSVVDTHRENTIYLDGDQVFIKGDNRVGELGDGTFVSKDIPVNITGYFDLDVNDEIIAVSLGEYHGFALSQNGHVYTWGHNANGKLGIENSPENENIPVDITDNFDLADDEKIIFIEAGRDNNAVITNYGRVFTFGVNSFGQLGIGEVTNSWEDTIYMPQDITDAFDLVGDFIIKVELGNDHSIALSHQGQVFVWGNNELGQLGTADVELLSPTNITDNFDLGDDQVIDVDLGYNHSGILTASGRVFVFGDNNFGQLGIGGEPKSTNEPAEITSEFSGSGDIYKLRFSHHSSAVIAENDIYVFGYNYYSQLGLEGYASLNTPTVLVNSTFADKEVVDIFIAKKTFTIVYEDETIESRDYTSR